MCACVHTHANTRVCASIAAGATYCILVMRQKNKDGALRHAASLNNATLREAIPFALSLEK